MKNILLSVDDLNALQSTIDYLMDSEKKSYEEYICHKFGDKLKQMTGNNYDLIMSKAFYNRPDIEHIYVLARRVRDAIKQRE